MNKTEIEIIKFESYDIITTSDEEEEIDDSVIPDLPGTPKRIN